MFPIRTFLIALGAATAVQKYFEIVFPPDIAKFAGLAAGGIELAGLLLMGVEFASFGLAAGLVVVATPLALLPGVVWLLQRYVGVGHWIAIPLASGILSVCVLFVAGHGAGKEGARLAFLLITLLSMFIVAAAALAWGFFPAATACVSIAATLAAGRFALVLPLRESQILGYASLSCLGIGAGNLVLGSLLRAW